MLALALGFNQSIVLGTLTWNFLLPSRLTRLAAVKSLARPYCAFSYVLIHEMMLASTLKTYYCQVSKLSEAEAAAFYTCWEWGDANFASHSLAQLLLACQCVIGLRLPNTVVALDRSKLAQLVCLSLFITGFNFEPSTQIIFVSVLMSLFTRTR